MRDEHGRPFVGFELPPDPPAAISRPYLEYRRLCDELSQTRFEYEAAAGSIDRARVSDLDALAAALRDGSPEPVESQERSARESAARLRVRVEALEAAVDAALDDVIDALVAGKRAWADSLRSAGDAARGRLAAALREAAAADSTIGTAEALTDWFAQIGDGRMFRTGGAHSGKAMAARWVGAPGGIRVKVPPFFAANSIDEHVPAATLLAMLAEAAARSEA